MKKVIIIILAIALLVGGGVVAAYFLTDGFGAGGGGEEPSFPDDGEPIKGLVLIEKNVAKFRVVTTGEAGADGMRAAKNLVDRLRELDIEVSDSISDKNVELVSDCEIIIGTGVLNRPEDCVVKKSDFGPSGECMKVVGDRVIIAGGSGTITRNLVNEFVKTYLGITDETTSRRNVGCPRTLNHFVETEYNVEQILIGETPITSYVVAYDNTDTSTQVLCDKIREQIENMSGITLERVDADSVGNAKYITVRSVEQTSDANRDGFYAFVDSNGNLIVECSVPYYLTETFDEFMAATFAGTQKTITLAKDFTWNKHIRTICYNDYGAKGNGTDNDFFFMKQVHEKANITGQTVVGKAGCTYLVSKTWTGDASKDKTVAAESIVVKSNCDFSNIVIKIDDTVANIHDNDEKGAYRRGVPIFFVSSDYNTTYYDRHKDAPSEDTTHRKLEDVEKDHNNNKALQIAEGATEIPWLGSLLEPGEWIVSIKNSNKKDYIRSGMNSDGGYDRQDILYVDGDGKVLDLDKDGTPDTPVIFEFKEVTDLAIRSVADTPITITGNIDPSNKADNDKSTFITVANQTKSQSNPEYLSYHRGIKVMRSNVTIKNIDHNVTGEGSNGKVYPYYGFISFNMAHNCQLLDSRLCAHKSYLGANGAKNGTYDLCIEGSNEILVQNLKQRVDIKNDGYWGIMASNGAKNMTFKDCVINRVDAHRGLWNLDIIGTDTNVTGSNPSSVIGLYINIIGGGTLNITNTVKRTCYSGEFINLRSDYGSNFQGNVIIKNCHFDAKVAGNWSGQSTKSTSSLSNYGGNLCIIKATYNSSHDFGYKCHMPASVTVDGFTRGNGKSVYVFNKSGTPGFTTPSNSIKVNNAAGYSGVYG